MAGALRKYRFMPASYFQQVDHPETLFNRPGMSGLWDSDKPEGQTSFNTAS